MAAFPSTVEPSPDSKLVPRAGKKAYITEGGGLRGRAQFAATVYEMRLIYEDLNDTEHDAILAHFAAGKADLHTVGVRGVTYNVQYVEEPTVVEYNGVLRTLQVDFLGTAA